MANMTIRDVGRRGPKSDKTKPSVGRSCRKSDKASGTLRGHPSESRRPPERHLVTKLQLGHAPVGEAPLRRSPDAAVRQRSRASGTGACPSWSLGTRDCRQPRRGLSAWLRPADTRHFHRATPMTIEPYIKDKIGGHLSYPTTVSELELHLAPFANPLALKVWLRAWKAPRKNELRERYSIIEVRYSPPGRESEWMLYIHPVPRPLRAAVHLLLPEACEHIRKWLMVSHSPVWHSFSHALFIDFVPESKSLVIHEFKKE